MAQKRLQDLPLKDTPLNELDLVLVKSYNSINSLVDMGMHWKDFSATLLKVDDGQGIENGKLVRYTVDGAGRVAIPAVSGQLLNHLDAAKITVGILDNARLTKGTVSEYGIVKMTNSYSGASQTLATTQKALFDGLATKIDKAGGDFSGDIRVQYPHAIYVQGLSGDFHKAISAENENVVIGDGTQPLIFRSSEDAALYIAAGSQKYVMYHSGNVNRSNVNWTANNLTAHGNTSLQNVTSKSITIDYGTWYQAKDKNNNVLRLAGVDADDDITVGSLQHRFGIYTVNNESAYVLANNGTTYDKFKIYHQGYLPDVEVRGKLNVYSKNESDARFVNITGDTINGSLSVNTTFRVNGATTLIGTLTAPNLTNTNFELNYNSTDGAYILDKVHNTKISLGAANPFYQTSGVDYEILHMGNMVRLLGGKFVDTAGDNMTGRLTVPDVTVTNFVTIAKNPTSNSHAVNKGYADSLKSNVESQLNTHKADFANPHKVTAAQVGAYTKAQSDANLSAHVTNKSNPHAVTKTQVGLGNVRDIAQVALAGDTMTGALGLPNLVLNGTRGSHITCSGFTGTLKQVIGTQPNALYLGNIQVQAHIETSGNIIITRGSETGTIYSTLNKPTASEVNAYSKTESDARFLGINATAKNSLKLEGLSKAQLQSEWESYTYSKAQADARFLGINATSQNALKAEKLSKGGMEITLNGNEVNYQITSGTSLYINHRQVGANRISNIYFNNGTANTTAFANIHAGAVYDNNNRVYSNVNKPSPATLGAVNKAGDTMTGKLTAPSIDVTGALKVTGGGQFGSVAVGSTTVIETDAKINWNKIKAVPHNVVTATEEAPKDSKVYGRKNGAWTDITAMGIPTGSMQWFMVDAQNIPTIEGMLVPDGRLVSRASYPNLFAMVMSGKLAVVTEAEWAAGRKAAYTLGDGSTTFRIPDIRGYFVRINDNGAGVDPAGATRKTGEIQVQDTKTGLYQTPTSGLGDMQTIKTVKAGTETRPSNVYMQPYIVFATGYETGSQDIDELVREVSAVRADLNAHEADFTNPHKVTAEQVDTYNKAYITNELAKKETPAGAQAKVNAHANLKNNPHAVTASQVGAYTKAQSDANLQAHTSNKLNPHNVTIAQIGAMPENVDYGVIG